MVDFISTFTGQEYKQTHTRALHTRTHLTIFLRGKAELQKREAMSSAAAAAVSCMVLVTADAMEYKWRLPSSIADGEFPTRLIPEENPRIHCHH